MKVFFSNRVETLYQNFKNRLYSNSHPFSRRIVFVPSAAMKSWLMLQMGQDPDLGVAAGIEIGFVEPSIKRLCNLIGKKSCNDTINEPSEFELALALEKEILHGIENFGRMTKEEQKQWHPLIAYLGTERYPITKRSIRRVCALSISLAKLFFEYSKFGGKLIAEWEFLENSELNWQQLLWRKMESYFHLWSYPYRKFESFEVHTDLTERDLQVHVFGLSYLMPLHHRLFIKVGQHLPVNYYVLSPCQKFWSDILSEKESIKLKNYWNRKEVQLAQQDILEDYLRDTNPFLANFGRLGREMAFQIESSDHLSEENYLLPSSLAFREQYDELIGSDIELLESGTSLTMLEALQADIALLRNPETTEKVSFEKYDGTIQIHSIPKPMREVQVVYDIIISLLEGDAEISPGDILVMTPNIAEYEPLIRAVFESSESKLNVHLSDLQIPLQNIFVQGFMHLLSLSFGRWDVSSLLRLFEYPFFRERHHLTLEDLYNFRIWMQKAGIRWGKDAVHRNEILRQNHCVSEVEDEWWNGTWEHGLGRLLEGLAMQSNPNLDDRYSPLEYVEMQQGDSLGNFVRLLRSLLLDLKPLGDLTLLTLGDWACYLKCLCETYFTHQTSGESREGYRLLMEHINAIGKAGVKLSNIKYTFYSIYKHLEEAFQTQTNFHRESNLQAVRFCSLLPMRAVPAKALILMGLQDGAFPRADPARSLNLLLSNPAPDYYPTSIDFDRYLFLEAILSARRYFITTYISQLPGEAKEQLPSLLLQELVAYLDNAYVITKGSISEECFYRHPLNSFHESYFSLNSRFKSYSKSNYLATKAHYHTEKTENYTFLENFISNDTSLDRQETVIDLSSLLMLAKDPLKSYFNKSLNIYFDREEDRRINNEEDLLLTKLNESIVIKEAVSSPLTIALKNAEKVGRLPQGPFRELETNRLKEELETLKANLLEKDILCENILKIEFNDSYEKPNFLENRWQLPSLCNEGKNGKVHIVGNLDMVSSKGLITLSKNDFESVIKIWPSILVFGCLVKKNQLPIELNVIFAKGKKAEIKKIDFNDLENHLSNYLEYYFQMKNSLSPLLPNWVPDILKGTFHQLGKQFKKNVKDDFIQSFDEYLKWLRRTSPHTDFDSLATYWQPTANKLFVDMGMAWYPKKMKNVFSGESDDII